MGARETESTWTRGIGIPKFNQEMLAVTIAALAAITLVWAFMLPEAPAIVLGAAGTVFTVAIVVVIRLMMDPDSVRALQSDAMLQMASSMIDAMGEGLTEKASQEVCELLLPNTSAIAVALTNRDIVLGYAGYQEAHNPAGIPIRTQATHAAIRGGETLVLMTPQEIGLPVPAETSRIKAAIVVPLWVGDRVEGTLKFYYRNANKITETQRSIAQGFAQLLATQMAAVEMETQRKLATSMELKMLQTQINPHFLFNAINTIASFIRTDPMKARTLLREFAVFYRRTLEDSTERISLGRELDQVQRYFGFELARFGDERLALEVNAAPEIQDMMVPPFLVQPLVENAIKHAMAPERQLVITIDASVDGDDVIIVVGDNGVGMTEETCANITQVESSTGLGIAVKNVHDRMIGFFGPDAQMVYTSELGVGTQVTLRCPGCAHCEAAEVAVADTAVVEADLAAETARNEETMAELTELVAQVSLEGAGGGSDEPAPAAG